MKYIKYILLLLLFGANLVYADDSVIEDTNLAVNNAFSPASSSPGAISRYTIILQNSAVEDAIQTNFINIFPENLKISDTPNLVNTCGGNLSTANDTITFSDGIIPAGDTINAGKCEISVDIYSKTKGAYDNIIDVGELKANINGVKNQNKQATKASYTTMLSDIKLEVNYELDGYVQGEETIKRTMTFINMNDTDITNVSYGDANNFMSLPENIHVIESSLENTCGGNVVFKDKDISYGTTSSYYFENLIIPKNSTCKISVNVEPSRDEKEVYIGEKKKSAKIEKRSLVSKQGVSNVDEIIENTDTVSGIKSMIRFNRSERHFLNSLDESALMTIYFDNYNTEKVENFDYTYTLPTANTGTGKMHIVKLLDNSCGGTLEGSGDTFTFKGGTLDGAEKNNKAISYGRCMISLKVGIDAPGTYRTETSGDLNGYKFDTTQGIVPSGAALSYETGGIEISKKYENRRRYQGDENVIIYTIENKTDENTGYNINNLAIKDILIDTDASSECSDESRKCVRVNGLITSNCNGLISDAKIDSNNLTFSGVSVEKGSSCVIKVPVVLRTDMKSKFNDPVNAGDITYKIEGSDKIKTTEKLESMQSVINSLSGKKLFTPDEVGANGITRLKITVIHNSYSHYDIEKIFFRDNFPAGFKVAENPNILNECGGNLDATPGNNYIELTNGKIHHTDTTAICNVYVNLKVTDLTGINPEEKFLNIIKRNNHGDSDLNFSAKKVGEVEQYNQLENYYDIYDWITVKKSSVSISKEFLETTVKGGAPSRVRITISNNMPGSVDLSDVSLTDTFAGTDLELYTNINPTFKDKDGTNKYCKFAKFLGSPGDDKITLSGAKIDTNSVCYFEFNISSKIGGNHINTINIGDLTSKEGASNFNSSSATLTVEKNINAAKAFIPNKIIEGNETELWIEVFNTQLSPNDETQKGSFVDEMPSGVKINSIVSNTCGGNVTKINQNGNDVIKLENGFFPAENSCLIKIKVTSDSSGVYTNIINKGTLQTVAGAENKTTILADLIVIKQPTISKKFSSSSAKLKETKNVVISITNPNDSTLLPEGITGVNFVDNLPDGLVIDSNPKIIKTDNCIGEFDYEAIPGASSFKVNKIAVKPNSTCEISFNVNAIKPGLKQNTIKEVNYNESDVPAGPSNTAEITVLEPLSIKKIFDKNEINLKDGKTKLTFVIHNSNSIDIDIGAGFTDIFPANPGVMKLADPINLTFEGCRYNPLVKNIFGTANSLAGEGGVKIFNGLVKANSDCIVSMDIVVNAAGNYFNETTEINSYSGIGAKASATLKVIDDTLTDLVTTKTVDVSNPKETESITYTISVKNNGPADATGVKLTDKLPNGVTFVESSGSGTYDSNSGEWFIGEIKNGKIVNLNITVSVNKGTFNTKIKNIISKAEGNEDDPTDVGNDLEEEIGVTQEMINLVTKKTVDNKEPFEGDTIEYNISVENKGPDTAKEVKLIDILPIGLIYKSDNSSGAYNSNSGEWNIGEIKKGIIKILKIKAEIGKETGGTRITNTIKKPTFSNSQIDSTDDENDLTEGIDVKITPPKITSDGGGDEANITVSENKIEVTVVQAKDKEDKKEELRYSIIGGVDSSYLTINPKTGKLDFTQGMDYENPLDSDKDNIYEVEVQVVDTDGMIDTQKISITITNEKDNPPAIVSDGGGDEAEITIKNETSDVTIVEGKDIEDKKEDLRYSIIDGEDKDLLEINEKTGKLKFKENVDFDNPKDSDKNNIYEVEVQVVDTDGKTDTQKIFIKVLDSEKTPPEITSDGGGDETNITIKDGTSDITTVIGKDLEDKKEDLRYSITGGKDKKLLEIDGKTGKLKFKENVDFNNPKDSDKNNIYEVEVQVVDTDGMIDIQKIFINIKGEKKIEIPKKPLTNGNSCRKIECFTVKNDKNVKIEEPIVDEKIEEEEIELNAAKEKILKKFIKEIDLNEIDKILKQKYAKINRYLPLGFQPVGPIHIKKRNLFVKYPTILPQTGGNGIITKLLDWKYFKLAGSNNTNLSFWLDSVVEEDRNRDEYIVLPTQGLVMPINTVSTTSEEAQKFFNGSNENFREYLRYGAVKIPGTTLNDYGENGNKVIAGHSSYWSNGRGRYKTHFQRIIEMIPGQEIWIYKKNNSGEFTRFVYEVKNSYNTKKDDIDILKPTSESVITLFTCTPIGGVKGRWIVRAIFKK